MTNLLGIFKGKYLFLVVSFEKIYTEDVCLAFVCCVEKVGPFSG